ERYGSCPQILKVHQFFLYQELAIFIDVYRKNVLLSDYDILLWRFNGRQHTVQSCIRFYGGGHQEKDKQEECDIRHGTGIYFRCSFSSRHNSTFYLTNILFNPGKIISTTATTVRMKNTFNPIPMFFTVASVVSIPLLAISSTTGALLDESP